MGGLPRQQRTVYVLIQKNVDSIEDLRSPTMSVWVSPNHAAVAAGADLCDEYEDHEKRGNFTLEDDDWANVSELSSLNCWEVLNKGKRGTIWFKTVETPMDTREYEIRALTPQSMKGVPR